MDKLKFFKATAFADLSVKRPDPTMGISPTGSVEIFLPIEAISHLTIETHNTPRGSYKIHVKKNYPLNLPFPIKSINPVNLSQDQVELIAQ